MGRYSLNLPTQLKKEAEQWAASQGVSLNQFILWSVAEKVGALQQQLDDAEFPHVTYRRGASGQPRPVVRGTGVHVQTLLIASENWGFSAEQLAEEYEVSVAAAKDALAFAEKHRQELELYIKQDEAEEATHA